MRSATAVRCSVFGKPESLIVERRELPAPRQSEVRIALRAAGAALRLLADRAVLGKIALEM